MLTERDEALDAQPQYIHTFSGKNFYFNDPSTVKITDIAHALSNICRWTGHVKRFYSVAQHSVICAQQCPAFGLRALLHDAAEAYIGDINKPLKTLLGQTIIDIESRIERAVWTRFGLSLEPGQVERRTVKSVDQRVGATEALQLMNVQNCRGFDGASIITGLKIEPLYPFDAEKLFLETFKELM